MSELYSVRVAARPDDRTVELDVKVVHPDAMHIPDSPGFALMLLHDNASGDDPLAAEVDLDTIMNREWAEANARAFVESVELLSSKNEPPPEALDDHEHPYWKRSSLWLEGRLRIRATHRAWVAHVPGSWGSAAFDPGRDYAACAPAAPGGSGAEITLETDYERSEGFMPVPRLAIASEVGRACPDTVWVPRHGARAYEAHAQITGMEITLDPLQAWLGRPVAWRSDSDGDLEVGVVTRIADSQATLVSISSGSRSTHSLDPEDLDMIGLAAFRRGAPRLAPPLQLEHILDYASPAAEAVSVSGREATIVLRSLARDPGAGLRLETVADILRLLGLPARDSFGEFESSTTKLGRALHREMQDRDLSWTSELYPQVAAGFVESFEVEAPAVQDRDIDLDEATRERVLGFIAEGAWPTWTVRVVVTDEAWLEHLESSGPWAVDYEELDEPEAWDDEPRTWDPDRDLDDDDDDDDDDDKSTLRRHFELPGPVTTADEALGADDPRAVMAAVLRDHGLWRDISHPAAKSAFEDACKSGNLEVVRAYIALGVDIEHHAEISAETPLIRAAEGNQGEVVRVLAEAGVDLQGRDHGGDTAIMTAINWTNPEVLRALLEVGASPDAPDSYENYPLVKALEGGDDELISILVEAGASPNAGAATQDSALQWCLRNSDSDRLRELLALDAADVDQATAKGDTLLHLAAVNDDTDAVEALLEATPDLARTNNWGWTARDVAVMRDATGIADLLEQAGAPLTKAETIALHQAIRQGDVGRVNTILSEGVDVDGEGPDGGTPLMLALDEEHGDIAKLLHARGADIHARDGDDRNLLCHASSVEQRRWLLESGVEAAYRDAKGKLQHPGVEAVLEEDDQELLALLLDANTDLSDLSVCHSSFIWGDYEERPELRAQTLTKLAAAGADIDAREDDGSSLLIGYINRGQELPAMALIEAGADLELEDKNFVTALLKSCGEYSEHEIQARITRALLERGADYSKLDWLSRSAWDEAKSVDNDECVAALEEVFEQTLHATLSEHGLESDADPEGLGPAVFESLARRTTLETFLHWVRKREYALVRGLLAAGFDPNPPARDAHGLRAGNLPLPTAISENDEEMVAVLLEGGADPKLVQTYGSTAISYAVGEEQVEVVRRLLAAGASPEVFDDSGYGPLYSAASKGKLELLELLVEAGASVNPDSNRPPLHAAVRNGQFEATQWLLARGANINARAEGRVTALHVAIDQDQVELALALVHAGADPGVVTSNEDRVTPLISATKKGNVELIEALLAAGADPHVQDANEQSAIDYAGYREELRALFPEGGAALTFETVERELPALLRAVHLGEREAFAEALADGDVDVRNYRGDTALMLAAGYHRNHMLEALLDAGAELEAKNAVGDTAWTYAFTAGAEDLRQLLEARGSETSMDALNQMAAQAMRRDAARAALEAGDIARVAKLIDELALDVDFLSAGVRPLGLARQRGDQAMAALLLARGADESLL